MAFMSFIAILAYKEIAFLKKYPNIVIVLGLISMLSIVVLNSATANYYLGIKYLTILIPIILLTLPSLLPKYQSLCSLLSGHTTEKVCWKRGWLYAPAIWKA